MTMLENTISMIKVMPEADLAEVQNFARKLLQRRDAGCPFPLKSREDIYKDLEVSRQQIQNGEYQEAGEFIAEVRKDSLDARYTPLNGVYYKQIKDDWRVL